MAEKQHTRCRDGGALADRPGKVWGSLQRSPGAAVRARLSQEAHRAVLIAHLQEGANTTSAFKDSKFVWCDVFGRIAAKQRSVHIRSKLQHARSRQLCRSVVAPLAAHSHRDWKD